VGFRPRHAGGKEQSLAESGSKAFAWEHQPVHFHCFKRVSLLAASIVAVVFTSQDPICHADHDPGTSGGGFLRNLPKR
jgi:hypothetical protein